MNCDLSPYFNGERLYGDDFSIEQIEQWYGDEKEAYADLGARDRSTYRYVYHELNRRHGFRHLRPGRFRHALGFGSAYGDELIPIADRIDRVTIVEPSAAFRQDDVHGIPTTFVEPAMDGRLPFPDATFDLVTCLDVLHHIPNVSRVIVELGRVCAPDGQAVLREPIISMGDWRRPRPGLTPRERGIPEHLLDGMVAGAGFECTHAAYCMFPAVPRSCALLGIDAFNSRVATSVDALLSRLFRWNLTYHARSARKKFRPTVKLLVLRRQGRA